MRTEELQDEAKLRSEAEELCKKIASNLRRGWLRDAANNAEKLNAVCQKIFDNWMNRS